ncbi:hypothetical protein [Streptomyces sp. MZ04]|uniref:hypothetical protein n=1 Tax=Streptomyces sp. MZ04 TaxID=2559236 RepID=UPI0014333904|nr:hypothetical protein [Streptomyces sp. MZ04]
MSWPGLFPLQCRADDRRARAVEEFVEAGVALRADGDTEFRRLDGEGEGEVDGLVLADEGVLQGATRVDSSKSGRKSWKRPGRRTGS